MTGLRWIILCLAVLIANAALAQEDDKGFLTNLLQDSLAGEGRDVQIEGFRGALSSEARIDLITVADDQGIWLRLEDVAMQWNRAALLQRRVEIQNLSAATIDVLRRPGTDAKGMPSSTASGFALPEFPVAITLSSLNIENLILDETIIGQGVELALQGSADLAGGSGAFTLTANRTDGREGSFSVSADYQRDTEFLNLNLKLDEADDGIAARLLNLPDTPPMVLSLAGSGPLDQFTADFDLATQGVERLKGQVTTAALAASDADAPVPRTFRAALNGDVAAMFAPQYRPFFGDRIDLNVVGQRNPDGSTAIPELQLDAQEISLHGEIYLDGDNWPTKLDLNGKLGSGDPVLLPLPGTPTSIDSAIVDVQFDAAQSDVWQSSAQISGLAREDLRADDLRLSAAGTLQAEIGGISQVSADIGFGAAGLAIADAAIGQVVGERVIGEATLQYVENLPLQLRDLVVRTDTVELRGSADVAGLSDGLQTRLDVQVDAGELSRFSGLAGRPLSGAARGDISGSLALGGLFDLKINGQVTDLTLDQPRSDRLLRGTTQFDLAARRTTGGTEIDKLNVENAQVSLASSGRIAPDEGQSAFALRIADFSLIEPQLPGTLTANGRADMVDGQVSIDIQAAGPLGSKATLLGQVTGPDAKIDFDASLADIGPLVPQFSGAAAAKGTLEKDQDDWRLSANLDGPGGTTARLAGKVLTDGRVDISAVGSLPLGLSEPFLRPRSLQGLASFDLSLAGRPSLSAVSGTITAKDARFVAPNLQITLNAIDAETVLGNGQAQISADARVLGGGRVSVTGPVNLAGGFDADFKILMRNVNISDPDLFRTTIGGDLTLRGALLGGARIAGDVDVGETSIIVPSSGMTSYGALPAITHIGAQPAVRQTQTRAGLNQTTNTNASDPNTAYALGITINAPSRIFVRGRGIDAELGGSMRLTGTTNDIVSTGRFDLIRGRLDLLEKRFDLDEGSLQMRGDFDPYLRFVAATETSAGTASIIIEGLASAPEVRFESVPAAPQDEVLAQIFFQRDIGQLSALQALQLANAIATLAGKGGEGVVSRLRRTFGLDDLEVTTDETGNTGLRVGKYISDNVYTDVTANNGGVGEVTLNIDLTPRITAKGSLSSEGESKLGIFFQRDY